MAKKTAIDTAAVKTARKKYDEQAAALGVILPRAIAALLASVIPEGWILRWEQKDDCYDDEDYYFGLECESLISEREPRRGEMIEPAKEEVSTMERSTYGGTYKRVTQYAQDARYAWHLDEACKARTKKSLADVSACDDAGVVNLDDYATPLDACGLAKKEINAVQSALKSLDEADLRKAFGDKATVTIWGDGRYEIK